MSKRLTNDSNTFVAALVTSMLLLTMLFSGCQTTKSGKSGKLKTYAVSNAEAVWITNGEPIEFEGENWYPQDGIETLLDSEVRLIGEYRDVQFFVDQVDVRPYNRLYTKFGKNRFRYFVRRAQK